MNRTIFSILCILPVAGTLTASAEAPPTPPTASQANSIIESSRISRFVAGPGDRPEGLLLRDGTFVNLSPGLTQQLPASLPKNATVRVAGDVLTYGGNKTIDAHAVTIAGVSYTEAVPASPPNAAGAAPSLPAGGAAAGGPGVLPPPPPPCGAGVAPPPPPQGAPVPPHPPASGGVVPPAPAPPATPSATVPPPPRN